MRILFFIESRKKSPSSRYRVMHIIPYLEEKGVRCRIIQGVPGKYFFFNSSNNYLNLIVNAFLLIIKTFTICLQIPLILWADIIVIQRELVVYNLIYPEKIIQLVKKKIVFDFDDAIYLRAENPEDLVNKSKFLETLVQKSLRIKETIKNSNQVIVGNTYIAQYAKQFNKNVSIIPSVIDTREYFPPKAQSFNYSNNKNKIIIGWMGTYSNLKFLSELSSVLKQVHKQHPYTQLLISTDQFLYKELLEKAIPTKYIRWTSDNELKTLQSFDIGIMPLKDDEWTRGKCGFKLIQYMATGVPAIASAVGVNNEIIKNGINGFLVNNKLEWKTKLSRLINDKKLRNKFGQEGRKTVEQKYSIHCILPKLINIYKSVLTQN
ncbi:MAG: glycosyltransferase family 4 protein [Promethearchaeota archaeon]